MANAQEFCQVDFDDKKPITFAPNEWTIFKDELDRQFTEGNGVNVFNALHRARYLAMLDRCSKQLEEEKVVRFTDEEWEAFVNEQKFY